MPRKKRKIGFYYLTINDENLDINQSFVQVVNHINNLQPVDKRKSIAGSKFGLLDTLRQYNNNIRYQLIFKSATNNFRPPLLDRDTVVERDSPKTLGEGETNKTHLISKAIGGELIVIVEKFMDGLSIKQIVNYLNSFSRTFAQPYHFGYESIVKDDFLEEVNALARITAAEMYVDKQLLGSEALDYSERINSVKHEIVISVKARNRESISDFARDIYARLNGGQQEIRRIKITGRNDDNNVVVLNTDVIERQEWVNPNINEDTGEILSNELLDEMEAVMFNFR